MKRTFIFTILCYLFSLSAPAWAASRALLVWDAYHIKYWGEIETIIDRNLPGYTASKTKTTDPTKLAEELVGIDAFIIPEQKPNDDEDEMQAHLKALTNVFRTYVEQGGRIVLLGADDDLLPGFTLLDATFAGSKNQPKLIVSDLKSPLLEGVQSPVITGNEDTYYYTLNENSETISVIKYQQYTVEAIKRIGKGTIVLLGYEFEEYDSLSGRIAANAISREDCYFVLNLTGLQLTQDYSTIQASMEITSHCPTLNTIEIMAWYSPSMGLNLPVEDGHFEVDLYDGDSFTTKFTWNIDPTKLGNTHRIGVNVLHPITGFNLQEKFIEIGTKK